MLIHISDMTCGNCPYNWNVEECNGFHEGSEIYSNQEICLEYERELSEENKIDENGFVDLDEI